MAAVAAMITGEPLAEVFDAIGHDGSQQHFRFLAIAAFLNHRGFHLGVFGKDFAGYVKIFQKQPALVIVASVSGDGTHAVFWSGTDFLDPEPANKWRTVFDYEILEWWPVTRYED